MLVLANYSTCHVHETQLLVQLYMKQILINRILQVLFIVKLHHFHKDDEDNGRRHCGKMFIYSFLIKVFINPVNCQPVTTNHILYKVLVPRICDQLTQVNVLIVQLVRYSLKL